MATVYAKNFKRRLSFKSHLLQDSAIFVPMSCFLFLGGRTIHNQNIFFLGFEASNIIKSSLISEPGVLLSELSVFGSSSCVPRSKATMHNIHNSTKSCQKYGDISKILTVRTNSIAVLLKNSLAFCQCKCKDHYTFDADKLQHLQLDKIHANIDSNTSSTVPCSWNRDSKRLTSTELL